MSKSQAAVLILVLILIAAASYYFLSRSAYVSPGASTSTASGIESTSTASTTIQIPPPGCGGCVGADMNGETVRISETSRLTFELPAAEYDSRSLTINPGGMFGETFGASPAPGYWVRTFEALKPGDATFTIPGKSGAPVFRLYATITGPQ